MRTHLRSLLERPGVLRLAGAHNPLGAKIAEHVGFDGVWASGLEISASFGVPDASILSMTEFLDAARGMAESVAIPIVADCDTGFGNADNVQHMVRRYEAAGVSAVSIEDKCFPKTNSYLEGNHQLATIPDFCDRIIAAKSAQSTSYFMVIARVEALIVGRCISEAINRAHAYADAGADAILIHSKYPTWEEIKAFAKSWDSSRPLVVVPTTYGATHFSKFGELGVRIVIYANQGIRAAIKATTETLAEILSSGSCESVEQHIATLETVFELQGVAPYLHSPLLSASVDSHR
jgi:phosphoenolpyruvate phosphomutase